MNLNLGSQSTSNTFALDTLLSIANIALTSAERLAALNLNAIHCALHDSSMLALPWMRTQNAPLDTTQNVTILPAINNAVTYSRSFFENYDQAIEEWIRIFESKVMEHQKFTSGFLNKNLKYAPAGTEIIFISLKASLVKTNTDFAISYAMLKNIASEIRELSVVSTTLAVAGMVKQ